MSDKKQNIIPVKDKRPPLSRKEKKLRKMSKRTGNAPRLDYRKRKHVKQSHNNGAISELHPINNAPIQTRCFRYAGTITSTTDFRIADMTKLLVAVTNGSTNAIHIMECVRINKVTCTLLPSSDTNSGTFTFNWSGEREPDENFTMFYAQGSPCRWTFRPPAHSLAGFWITQDTTETQNSIFTLDPDNSVVKLVLDLHVQYVIADGISASTTMSGASSFTGIACPKQPVAATDELTPVGITSVTL